MSELSRAARQLDRALKLVRKTGERYFVAALAAGKAAPNGPTARGLDDRQVRRRLKEQVIATLSPKPIYGMPDPPFMFDGAPEARRFVAANPLPGLEP